MRVLAINSTIGAVFGTIFVIVNAQSLSTFPADALCVVAVVALVVVIARGRALRKLPDVDVDVDADGPTYGRSYRLVVAAEIVVLAAGIPVVRTVIGNHAIVGWIALIVGLHFLGLAAVWHRARFAVLAVVVAGCGLTGLILAAGSARTSVVATVSGVVPGFLLLAFALQTVLSAKHSRSAATSAVL